MDDIFLQAAKAMPKLIENSYILTYGFKNTIKSYHLKFEDKDFFHMAGFQYMKDISLPKYGKSQYLNKVLNGEITYAQIAKSENFERMILPRLIGIVNLNGLLHSEFKTYIFNKRVLNFNTDLEAKFLIANKDLSTVVFLFLDKDAEEDEEPIPVFCRSVFVEDEGRDYTTNQKAVRIMYKEISGEENYIFIDKRPK